MAQDLDQEREFQAQADELAILRHAERIKIICNRDRAISALEQALSEICNVEMFSERRSSGLS